jgi:twitching motility two-component system response regulator PilH
MKGKELSKAKILIVDDDAAIRRLMKFIITNKFTCEVIEAENGEDCLKKIENENPVLVILDILMPVMSGEQALIEIRKNPKSRYLPVILCSALKDKKIATRFILEYRDQFQGYITKPFDQALLSSKIDPFIKRVERKKMQIFLNSAGEGSYFFEPNKNSFHIKITGIDGIRENDFYTLYLPDGAERSGYKKEDIPMIAVPSDDKMQRFTFKFNSTRFQRMTIYYEIAQ